MIFKLAPNGTETVLLSFSDGKNGTYPNGGLLRDSAGNLYGTTMQGGRNQHGVVYKLTAPNKETVLYTFQGFPDGSQPQSSLIRDAAGNFYGTTMWGGNAKCGAKYCGTVFKLSPAGAETILYNFTSGPDGSNPNGGLVMDGAGNLYGTTSTGGAPGCGWQYACGTVFKWTPSHQLIVLYTFPKGGLTYGADPMAGLVMDAAGNLYGTASEGGDPAYCGGTGCGVIFKITP